MCTAVCLNEGYEGFATISKENCWCSNQAIPSPTSSDVCSPSCKSEPWLSCGGEDDSTAVFRALSYFGVSSRFSVHNGLSISKEQFTFSLNLARFLHGD